VPASGVTTPQATPSAPPATARLGPPRRPPKRLPVPGRTGIPFPIPSGWPF
jgi:hypothetical protein